MSESGRNWGAFVLVRSYGSPAVWWMPTATMARGYARHSVEMTLARVLAKCCLWRVSSESGREAAAVGLVRHKQRQPDYHPRAAPGRISDRDRPLVCLDEAACHSQPE